MGFVKCCYWLKQTMQVVLRKCRLSVKTQWLRPYNGVEGKKVYKTEMWKIKTTNCKHLICTYIINCLIIKNHGEFSRSLIKILKCLDRAKKDRQESHHSPSTRLPFNHILNVRFSSALVMNVKIFWYSLFKLQIILKEIYILKWSIIKGI